MQLNRAMRRIEHNGMTVSLVAVYDYEQDHAGYEVTKTLEGQILHRETIDSFDSAVETIRLWPWK